MLLAFSWRYLQAGINSRMQSKHLLGCWRILTSLSVDVLMVKKWRENVPTKCKDDNTNKKYTEGNNKQCTRKRKESVTNGKYITDLCTKIWLDKPNKSKRVQAIRHLIKGWRKKEQCSFMFEETLSAGIG